MDRALLEMEYTDGSNRHTLRLHVLPVAPTPVGPFGDLAYVTPPAGGAGEASVLATFDAFALFWALYYADTWALALIGVWAQDGDAYTVLPALPSAPTVPASIMPTGDPPHSTRRRLHLYTTAGARRWLTLAQVNAGEIGPARSVTPEAGGFDARDQDMMAYLSSPTTALVGPDGAPFAGTAVAYSSWDRPVS